MFEFSNSGLLTDDRVIYYTTEAQPKDNLLTWEQGKALNTAITFKNNKILNRQEV